MRGLHEQLWHLHGSFVCMKRGEAVDIRLRSGIFSNWRGTVLSEEHHRLLYIPRIESWVVADCMYLFAQMNMYWVMNVAYGGIIKIEVLIAVPIVSDKNHKILSRLSPLERTDY